MPVTLWVCRPGRGGEYENFFLDGNLIGISYGFREDVSAYDSYESLKSRLSANYSRGPHPPGAIALGLRAGALWRFAKELTRGDWVIVPFSSRPVLCVAEVTGDYAFAEVDSPDPLEHTRAVRWIAQDIPRTAVDSELIASLNGRQTLYIPQLTDAQARIQALVNQGPTAVPSPRNEEEDEDEGIPDLEATGRDLIARRIIERFHGHGLARLAGALLEAQGYTVFVSPPGPDGGIDIRAAMGPLGLGEHQVCAQVKSGISPAGHPELQQLHGSMANAGAAYGLFLSWNGFTRAVLRERATQFFKVRLLDQTTFIDELLTYYEKLPATIRAELSLTQVWTVTPTLDVE